MNANDLTFGVELEVTLPRTVTVQMGSYHNGRQVEQLPAGWNAQSDSSISAAAGFYGVEIVSPVLKGADGLQQVVKVCEWLNSVGAKVNRSTGFHVHVGFNRRETEALGRLVTLVAQNEKALFAITGTHSREGNHYCKGVQQNPHYVAKFQKKENHVRIYDRYHTLNLTSEKPTVEFRVFAGTTSAVKAVGYVRLCLGLVEKALNTKRAGKWAAKKPVETSPLHRDGEGYTALTKLLYSLGWTKGQAKQVWGEVAADNVPSIEETKKEFVRLAKKYDNPEVPSTGPLPVEA